MIGERERGYLIEVCRRAGASYVPTCTCRKRVADPAIQAALACGGLQDSGTWHSLLWRARLRPKPRARSSACRRRCQTWISWRAGWAPPATPPTFVRFNCCTEYVPLGAAAPVAREADPFAIPPTAAQYTHANVLFNERGEEIGRLKPLLNSEQMAYLFKTRKCATDRDNVRIARTPPRARAGCGLNVRSAGAGGPALQGSRRRGSLGACVLWISW